VRAIRQRQARCLVPSAPLTSGSTCADAASRPTSNSMDWSSPGGTPRTPADCLALPPLISPDPEVQIDAVALPLDLVDLALAELLTASLERQHLRILREMVERTANRPPLYSGRPWSAGVP